MAFRIAAINPSGFRLGVTNALLAALLGRLRAEVRLFGPGHHRASVRCCAHHRAAGVTIVGLLKSLRLGFDHSDAASHIPYFDDGAAFGPLFGFFDRIGVVCTLDGVAATFNAPNLVEAVELI